MLKALVSCFNILVVDAVQAVVDHVRVEFPRVDEPNTKLLENRAFFGKNERLIEVEFRCLDEYNEDVKFKGAPVGFSMFCDDFKDQVNVYISKPREPKVEEMEMPCLAEMSVPKDGALRIECPDGRWFRIDHFLIDSFVEVKRDFDCQEICSSKPRLTISFE